MKKIAEKTFVVFSEHESYMIQAETTKRAAEMAFREMFDEAENVFVLSTKPAQMFGRTTAVKRIKNGA